MTHVTGEVLQSREPPSQKRVHRHRYVGKLELIKDRGIHGNRQRNTKYWTIAAEQVLDIYRTTNCTLRAYLPSAIEVYPKGDKPDQTPKRT